MFPWFHTYSLHIYSFTLLVSDLRVQCQSSILVGRTGSKWGQILGITRGGLDRAYPYVLFHGMHEALGQPGNTTRIRVLYLSCYGG